MTNKLLLGNVTRWFGRTFETVFVLALIFFSTPLWAANYRVVYSFPGVGTGFEPLGGVVQDPDGNFIGLSSDVEKGYLFDVFRMTPAGEVTILDKVYGRQRASLSVDAQGTIYGTSAALFDDEGNEVDAGSVFKLNGAGKAHVIVKFEVDSSTGENPHGRLAIDDIGNVYGTNYESVFRIGPHRGFKVLRRFSDKSPKCGVSPDSSSIALDADGNLYGTTYAGGAYNAGVVFKLSPSGSCVILHSFKDVDGANPEYGVTLDSEGNIVGNTFAGGDNNEGVIFKVAPDGTTTRLFSFGGAKGSHPTGNMIRDEAGNLYGTAGGGVHGKGVVYKVTPGGQGFVLHAFGATSVDGTAPSGRLIHDKSGNLYGTTASGGTSDAGTVFRIGE